MGTPSGVLTHWQSLQSVTQREAREGLNYDDSSSDRYRLAHGAV